MDQFGADSAAQMSQFFQCSARAWRGLRLPLSECMGSPWHRQCGANLTPFPVFNSRRAPGH
eukprot:2720930-Pyramimonas_sp.AAC.1